MGAWISPSDVERWADLSGTIAEGHELAAFAAGACSWVEDYCRRAFLAADYSDVILEGTGLPKLYVPNGPIQSVASLSVDGAALTMGSAADFANGQDVATIDRRPGARGIEPNHIRYRGRFPDGSIVLLTFNGGWTNAESVPQSIRDVASFVGALFLKYPEIMARKSKKQNEFTEVFDKNLPDPMKSTLLLFRESDEAMYG